MIPETTRERAREAAAAARVPVINAGDGAGEHPTQALLDLYTILHERQSIDGLHVAMVGDLRFGRTVHSLAKLLTLFDVRLNYVAPDILKMPPALVEQLEAKGMRQAQYDALEPVMAETDVLYVTRVQKERFEDLAEYEQVKGAYVISPETMTHFRPRMALMHPLPRVGEIAPLLTSREGSEGVAPHDRALRLRGQNLAEPPAILYLAGQADRLVQVSPGQLEVATLAS